MIIKIYFEDKPVFLCDEVTPAINEFMHHPDAIFIEEISSKAIKSLLHEIVKPDFHLGILLNDNIEKLTEVFFKQFVKIEAAGGLVKNELNEVLFIFRRGKWDLPKGKNDKDENAKDCAIREVTEETGLKILKAGKKILTTYHTYNEFGKHILKQTEWFNMKANSKQKLIPQADEGIEKIEWVNKVEVSTKLLNSFPLISDVLTAAGVYGEA